MANIPRAPLITRIQRRDARAGQTPGAHGATLDLIGQDVLPFRNLYGNPISRPRVNANLTYVNSSLRLLGLDVLPFLNSATNPVRRPRAISGLTHTDSVLRMIGLDVLPVQNALIPPWRRSSRLLSHADNPMQLLGSATLVMPFTGLVSQPQNVRRGVRSAILNSNQSPLPLLGGSHVLDWLVRARHRGRR